MKTKAFDFKAAGDVVVAGAGLAISGHPKGERRFSGVDGKDVPEFVLKGRMGMARA